LTAGGIKKKRGALKGDKLFQLIYRKNKWKLNNAKRSVKLSSIVLKLIKALRKKNSP
jgi:hypothetical protein